MRFKNFRINTAVAALITGILILAGAVNPSMCAADQKAISINVAPDFTSGAHSIIAVDPLPGPRNFQNDLNPTISDLGLNSFGRHFYVIERFMGDNITKYDIENPTTPIWQYSARDDQDTAANVNPYNIVFATEKKAYLLRHNNHRAWIINPSAENQDEFKTGVLDLSAYNDQDDFGPEMTNGVIVDNKLFIVMQRMNQNAFPWEPNEAFVAVFDITTDTEINTGRHADLNGIPLPVKNPSDIAYEATTGLIYVQGQGRFEFEGVPAEYSGGIATIDPETYATSLLVDDGDENHHPYGNISGMTILSAEKGYFIGYTGWGDTTLYQFNPSTGDVSGMVHPDLTGINIAGVAVDQNARLWVADATDAQIVVINPEDNSINETISTNLNPEKIVFVTYSATSPEAERVFNWAQRELPELLPAQGMLSIDIDGWYIRYYSLTDIYLGVYDGILYLYQPSVSPEVFDLGSIDDWLIHAENAGF